MHIKQIVLAGFKSYRDETTIQDLGKGLNVIVGKNGTGKTNIFAAIRYVLDKGSDASNLRNSGAPQGQECFVELAFDNTDQRFLTLPEEVTIRRSVDVPTDYWVNGRKTQQRDVLNYLESAGFISSGFYIVPQGKVASLINASDAERLTQLLEASGLMVFERKKAESLTTLTKTQAKVSETEALLGEISSKIAVLKNEKEVLIERELLETRLAELKYVDLMVEYGKVDEILAVDKDKLGALRAQRIRQAADLAQLQDQKKHLEAKMVEANIILESHDQAPEPSQLESGAGASREVAAEAAQQAKEWRDKLAEAKEAAASNQQQLDILQSQVRGMLVKQAAQSKFKTETERNAWLNQQIQLSQARVQEAQTTISALKHELASIHVPVAGTQAVDRISEELNAAKDAAKRKITAVSEAQGNLREAQLARRKNEVIVQNLNTQINDLKFAESNTIGAIEQARQIAIELGLQDKFHGPVANLMEVDDMFAPAVEAVAKASLFYCVVDDINTVKQITTELSARKLPRVSFIPLSQVDTKKRLKVETHDMQDAAPLMDQIKVDSKFQPAVDLVISNALLCSNLETGWRCSRGYRVECVTMEGSLVSPFGALRGGASKSPPKSRFSTIREIVQLYQRRALAQNQVNDSQIDLAQQQISRAHNEANEAKQRAAQLFSQLDSARRELERATQAIEIVQEQHRAKEAQLGSQVSLVDELCAEIRDFEQQLQGEFVAPNVDETMRQQELLKRAESQQRKLDEQVQLATRELEYASKRHWDASLMAEREFEAEAEGNSAVASREGGLQQYNQAKAEQQLIRSELPEVAAQISESSGKLAHFDNEIRRLEFREEKFEELRVELERDIKNSSVPFSEISLRDAALQAEIEKVESKIQRMGTVNELAEDQHEKYSQEYEHHEEYRKQLLNDLAAGQKMVKDLEAYKSTAILEVYKGISKAFSVFFHQLTRGDTAKLHVEGTEPLDWQGIEVTVSFAGHRKLRIEQLSGGQKALCALAFLLALQASDPAPFYIFDEVDASLDSQYRGSLAFTLDRISKGLESQFICTTFGPELVSASEKVYGTAFAGGSSKASEIDQETALTLVDSQK